MSEQLTDQQLVERVQRGDKNAFNLLVKKVSTQSAKFGISLCEKLW